MSRPAGSGAGGAGSGGGAASPMEAEFDVVAAWTEQAVAALGPQYAVAAACRGSGSPAALGWLADALRVRPGVRMLDAGSGLGGPAAWLADRYGVRPYCAEPMHGAAAACRRLFGLPTVSASAAALPYPAGTFDLAWCLGVLCTTTDKAAILTELRRVLRPGGEIGLLVYAATGPITEPRPAGNAFPAEADLPALLGAAGLIVAASAAAADLPPAPPDWQRRGDRVDLLVADRHRDHPSWQQARRQSARIGHLLDTGQLRAVLLHATTR
jgi:SAM-dependent methyltransferase